MELSDIKTLLGHADSQERLKGIVALKDYDADIASPLLLSKKDDAAFLVRSFVAMGLGRKRSPEGYTVLQSMIDHDSDPNVQAEATNSLAMYGADAIPHLVNTFHHNSNWLVRRSILAAMIDLKSPAHMLEICLVAIQGSDLTVMNAGIDHLSTLANSDQASAALDAILPLRTDQSWHTRMHVAYALKRFKADAAQAALIELRQDDHHKVVAAALEGLVP
ncbi:HEAT repeat domain-containing protein [Leptothoe kymatousa]|uniref:HEAT repeat domain-containing protein n=1 Tax=Leptothoe kymatousa TAU-MAC 1615 TaxID=2364775 RepID=A0ABS5Y278_9CYAN|nr:HEAT repeat domain-containing protein [Leptothoe kymatousa]MBT9311608.1 HEAT repeat domain-containing protein [Leptothoe kymatousa TAU-MAC 1615]